MTATRQRDTAAERALRTALHKHGLRYRIQVRPVTSSSRRADIVFGPSKVAVFVDGCFWHACPLHATWPKANSEFWRDKILMNKRRDEHTTEALQQHGWTVIRIWEHEDPEEAATQIKAVVLSRRKRL